MPISEHLCNYTVRPARLSDSRFIYELSMDPRVRLNSTRKQGFMFEEHQRWYEDKLAHPEAHRIWIMEIGEIPVGQVRYGMILDHNDASPGAEISISIVPREWRKGYALTLLIETMPLARAWLKVNRLVALVLRRNFVSRRLFRRAGFKYGGLECRAAQAHAKYEHVR